MFNFKPKIRTVSVPVKKPAVKTSNKESQRKPSATSELPAPTPKRPSKSLERSHSGLKNGHANTLQTPDAHNSDRRRSLAVKNPHRKRKANTPTTPQWASSSSEDESEADDGSRKRQKTSTSLEPDTRKTLEPDPGRRVRDIENVGGKLAMIHGTDMTGGDHAKEFKPAFSGQESKFVVELQYPSQSPPERFETVITRDPQGWDPIKDIEYTVDEIISNYLPSSVATELQSEISGTVRLLKRAVAKNSPEDYRSALSGFNDLIKESLPSTIPSVLDNMHSIPLSLVRRILAQVYQRTVSPKAHLLRRVKDKATTYGELLPPLVHTIFAQTRLNSSCVFVDLGSGVGNVVLQSALQTGAESWGIEIMDTAAEFALSQASELKARAKLWNLSSGPIHLLHGDFLESPEIDAALRRADVVLVNNKVFPQKLNGLLLDKFLDLKEGCRVVSLETFTGGNKQGVRNEQSVATLFEEQKHESGTQSVSWAGEGVDYYIATKVR